jgi:MHS family proline/betaine transporter-like MFS transporter
VLIGVVPSYDSIGAAAPAVIVLARLMQGFSAGGEWGGSTAFIVEWAPEGRRGFYGSFQQSSVAGGLLLGSGIAALISTVLPAETVNDWGWRIPFLLGALLGPVGLYMRRNIDETPAFQRAQHAPPPLDQAPPLVLAARAFGFTILWTVSYYIMLQYMPTFTQRYAQLGRSESLWANTICLVVLVVAIPVMGLLSDRIGRKPLLLACCAGFVALTYPLFTVMLSAPGFVVIMWIQILFALLIALFSGPGPAAIAEIFPTRTRSTWMSTGYSLAVAIFGGFAPFLATWLITATGSPIAPTWYVIAAGVVSGALIMSLRETAHGKLA